MKAAEIRELSTKDLIERIEAEKLNFSRMKMNHAISPVENTSLIKVARKNIARMLTVLSEKEINEIKK